MAVDGAGWADRVSDTGRCWSRTVSIAGGLTTGRASLRPTGRERPSVAGSKPVTAIPLPSRGLPLPPAEMLREVGKLRET